MHPLFVPADLAHVDVDRGHVLVAAFESRIHVAARRPLPEVLHLLDHLLAESFREEWKPIHIGARLLKFGDGLVHHLVVAWMDILHPPFLKKGQYFNGS